MTRNLFNSIVSQPHIEINSLITLLGETAPDVRTIKKFRKIESEKENENQQPITIIQEDTPPPSPPPPPPFYKIINPGRSLYPGTLNL